PQHQAAAVQRAERGAGVRIKLERPLERPLQGAPGERLERRQRGARFGHRGIVAAAAPAATKKPAVSGGPFRSPRGQGHTLGPRPRMSETTATIRKMTNRIQAMLVIAPAMPLKPSTAAMMARTKNSTA